ncbi:lipid-binding SYLF domain-containing protein [Accumulibacter sp.]|uniref:lipid-binding SYLF domain-containing protein n=1 Tax=Accumulibacter sp. TaxID=2053492 RepID=UPI00262D5BD1|nr:lipid-binding SYLF domain-containing protein [Accumulibacter sp.]
MYKTLVSRVAQLTRCFLAALVAALVVPASALAAEGRAALEQEAQQIYQKLVAKQPAAKALSRDAAAVLVFPKITKAGLVVGGQYGDGVLFKGGKVAGYYNTAGASYGLQAGAQQYAYAMFFMNEKALEALNQNDGLEIGVGPSVVVVDQGMGKSLTSTTAKDDIYAFIFSQKGLMAGIGLQGNKITKLND